MIKDPIWAEFEEVKKIFVFPAEMRSLLRSVSAGTVRPPVPGNAYGEKEKGEDQNQRSLRVKGFGVMLEQKKALRCCIPCLIPCIPCC